MTDLENVNPLIDKLSSLIHETHKHINKAINSTMILLYWKVGKNIFEFSLIDGRAEYGKGVLKSLSDKLTFDFGKGFSERNLARMIKFYEFYPDEAILPSLMAKLSWTHFIQILSVKEPVKREFYITMCKNEGWSVRELSERINKMLFERTLISKKPEQTILNDLKLLKENKEMSVDLFLKDPYIFDFLRLKDTYSELDLENAILVELQKFIQEFGSDFAFLARQKRITIDNEDFYIDLLFFHRKLKRLVVIELKLGKFKPEHKSQLELYLRWLNKFERNEGENEPIGLLLCSEKSDQMIELLELDKSGIHVSTYLTEFPPLELFRLKLEKSIIEAKNKFNFTPENYN